MPIEDALSLVSRFKGGDLAETISCIESSLKGADFVRLQDVSQARGIGLDLLHAVAAVKRASAQIDVVIHAVGILLALPHILGENEEIVSTSLGAGSAHSDFDLVTSDRIAEFKFIYWQGGAESVRKQTLFQDFYRLAREADPKPKELYLLNTEIPLRFLRGGTSTTGLLRNRKLAREFALQYGERYSAVGQFYAAHQAKVTLVNLIKIAPEFATFVGISADESEGA
jgi:hypothetical protein